MFGVLRNLITNNVVAFKLKKMVEFCFKYHIQLGQSTSYYPEENGLEESSNKSLMRIIKNMLQDNKKAWHTKLTHALWDDRISVKKSIGTSPFQLVYGYEVFFLSSMSFPVMRLLHEEDAETHPTQRRMYQLVEL